VVEGRLLVVASAAGIERNPGWYHNLVANPIVTVEWQGEAFRAEAIVTQGEERDRLFNQLDEVYITLQAATARQFPIIELRRLEGAS
jgi:deazaflavin-dependent oxidoreductase (nitroreductase family)